jgi:hypothetical protein
MRSLFTVFTALAFFLIPTGVFAEIRAVPSGAKKTELAPAQKQPAESSKAGALVESHRAAIERLLEALEAKKNMELSMKAGASLGLGLNNQQLESLPREQREKFQKALKKALDIIAKELSWDSIKDRIVETYGKTFTEKEALEIAEIMESPAGKLLVSKQNQLSADLMRISQEKMKTLMPKVAAIVQQEMLNP